MPQGISTLGHQSPEASLVDLYHLLPVWMTLVRWWVLCCACMGGVLGGEVILTCCSTEQQDVAYARETTLGERACQSFVVTDNFSAVSITYSIRR